MRRVGVGAAVVLLLAGCGGAAHRTAAPPPIKAVNEAPPRDVLAEIDQLTGVTPPTNADVNLSQLCVVLVKLTAKAKPRHCTAAEIAAGQASARRFQQAIAPAQGEVPRVVAVLRLPYGFRQLLIVWPTRSGRLCMSAAGSLTTAVDEPFGPCRAVADRAAGQGSMDDPSVPPCAAICVYAGLGSLAGTSGYYLAGTVPADATSLRVTVGGGAVTTYPLRGPFLPGTRSRVFMSQIGARDWRKLELLRDKTVVSTQVMPARAAAFQDCGEKYSGSNSAKLRSCSARARALPGP